MSDDALIVAAGKWASGDYDRYDAYICQPKRKVPATGRLGFYDNGKLLQYLPQITGVARTIECSTNGLALLTSRRDLSTRDLDRAKALLRRLLDDKNHRVTKKETVTFVFLTPKSDRDTIVLKRTINNDKLDKNGNRTAFTQNHRYVSIDALLKATTTSDLEGSGRHDDLNGTVLDDGPRAGEATDDLYELQTGIKKGQRYHNNKAARKAIELRAMEVAKKYYTGQKWSVNDVSKNRPYDLECTRHGARLRVEVKGTTSDGSKVLLTRNEAQNAREYPEVALFVVSHISISESPGGQPAAGGGRPKEWNPWKIDQGLLEAVAFEYSPPEQRGDP